MRGRRFVNRPGLLSALFPALLLGLAGCGGGGSSSPPGPLPPTSPTTSGAIKHVVIIIQENRTFDTLFNGFPGANSVQSARLSTGQVVALHPNSLTDPQDINHSHLNWERQYAGGNLFFDRGSPAGQPPDFPYAYVPTSETQPYWDLARTYTLGDNTFQSNSGPSFPAHLYLTAASAQFAPGQNADENPNSGGFGGWGCDDPPGTTVALLGPTGTDVPGPFPCFDYTTLADEMDAAGVSWRYYAPTVGSSGGIWSAYDAIKHIRYGADWTNDVVTPETSILTDAPNGNLPAVTWVAPTLANSDHAGSRSTSGPQWVASVVDAIGHGPDWNSTAIFIVWDDWGGWFDHVVPPQVDAMGLGFRVPLIVVSPYAKRGYVSHVQHEFGSILKFTERNFGLATLGASDARADDLGDCFNFSQSPSAFTPASVRRAPASFVHGPEATSPDDD